MYALRRRHHVRDAQLDPSSAGPDRAVNPGPASTAGAGPRDRGCAALRCSARGGSQRRETRPRLVDAGLAQQVQHRVRCAVAAVRDGAACEWVAGIEARDRKDAFMPEIPDHGIGFHAQEVQVDEIGHCPWMDEQRDLDPVRIRPCQQFGLVPQFREQIPGRRCILEGGRTSVVARRRRDRDDVVCEVPGGAPEDRCGDGMKGRLTISVASRLSRRLSSWPEGLRRSG